VYTKRSQGANGSNPGKNEVRDRGIGEGGRGLKRQISNGFPKERGLSHHGNKRLDSMGVSRGGTLEN